MKWAKVKYFTEKKKHTDFPWLKMSWLNGFSTLRWYENDMNPVETVLRILNFELSVVQWYMV